MSALTGEIIVLGQHTGGDVQLRVYGDEFYGRYETLEGYTVIYDTDRGSYCYVTLASGHFVSTGVPIGKPIPAGIRRHLKEDPEVRNETFGQRYDDLRTEEVTSFVSGARTQGSQNGLLTGRKLHTGTVRGLTIIVDFDDIRTNIPTAAVDAMFNDDDYSTNGNVCSVRTYFQTVSNNKLDYSNLIVGPVQLSQRRSYYINNSPVREAIDTAVSDFGLDLSQFDSRSEGIVDAINILYAGESQYVGKIWPHNSVMNATYNGVSTHYYQVTGLGTHPVDLRVGTIIHENGHLLCRFPDMYDYGERDDDFEKSQGIGRFCLMGSGNHLNGRRSPAAVCGYLRELAGWTDTTISLNGPGTHTASHGSYDTVMKYQLDIPNEYYIVENRSKLGLDAHLPDGGLAVYHCDTLGSNEWQQGTRNQHYQCALIQADGHLDLENNRNSGDAGDLFPETLGVALSHDTIPGSLRWDGSDSGLLISDIGPAGQQISFTSGLSATLRNRSAISAPNLLIPDRDPAGIEDVIQIDEVGELTDIQVAVNIVHPYIGDLTIGLVTPVGTVVSLRERSGEGADDIDETYGSDTLPPLAALSGEPITGAWALRVVDHAGRDIGRLVTWTLDLTYKTGQVISETNSTQLAIPDANLAGVASVIDLTDGRTVNALSVEIDLTHTYIGDLQIDLRAPSGRSARLHNLEGHMADDIHRTYDSTTTPDLLAMQGEPISGEWQLIVRDLAAFDEGHLESWSLSITPSP